MSDQMCPMSLYMPTAFGQYIELYEVWGNTDIPGYVLCVKHCLDVGDYRDDGNALLALNFYAHVQAL